MVPLSERDDIVSRAKADTEMKALLAFICRQPFDFSSPGTYPHLPLLLSIVQNDKQAFAAQVEEFKQRRTSENSAWYEDDSLLFLLLVGCERFQANREFLEPILAARDRNTNPVPKRVAEVFRAIQRREYSLEGEFAFIKIPFLDLVDQLSLSNEAAGKVHAELTQRGNLKELSPFLQVLATRAFDLILFQRKPKHYDGFDDLVQGIEKLKDRASVRQALALLWALPYKWALAIPFVLAALIGYGGKAYTFSHSAPISLTRPSTLNVLSSSDASLHQFLGVRALAAQGLRTNAIARVGEHLTTVAIETSKFQQPTSKFSVEILLSNAKIADAAVLLIQPSDGGHTQTILPVQQRGGAVRAFVPPSDTGAFIIFVMQLRTTLPVDVQKEFSAATVRTLD